MPLDQTAFNILKNSTKLLSEKWFLNEKELAHSKVRGEATAIQGEMKCLGLHPCTYSKFYTSSFLHTETKKSSLISAEQQTG